MTEYLKILSKCILILQLINLVLCSFSAVAQEFNLPKCSDSKSKKMNPCIGEKLFRDGSKY
jgi:hypothetical protein